MNPSADSLKVGCDFVVVDSSLPEFQTVGIVDSYKYKCEDKNEETAPTHTGSLISPNLQNLDSTGTSTTNIGNIARSSLKPVFANFESKFINADDTEKEPVLRQSDAGHSKVNKLKFAMDEGIKDNIINEELLCPKVDGERICPLRKKILSKVRFTVDEIAAKSKARLDELLDYKTRYTSTCAILSKSKVQSVTLVKEKPSSEYACTLDIHENEITLYPNKQIQVKKLEDAEEEVWEIEPGYQIFKALDPIEYSPNRAKMGILENKSKHVKEFAKLDLKAEGDKLIIAGSAHCSEFLAPLEVADLFVSSTIGHAKEQYYIRIMNYGDPEVKRLSSLIPIILKVNSNWSSIKHMTKEQGIYHIERYIVMTSELDEDWKYTIIFKGAQSDKVSDHYFYETTFTIEGTQLKINPDKYTLKDNVLLRVLNTKLKFIKNCSI